MPHDITNIQTFFHKTPFPHINPISRVASHIYAESP